MYADASGGITCCLCRLKRTVNLPTPEEAVEHLRQHRRAGHKVPEATFDMLLEEIALEELE